MKKPFFFVPLFFVFLSFCFCESEELPVDSDSILGHWDIEGGGTLYFEEDSFSASTGCNSLFGEIEITDNSLSFSRLASTLMACPGPEGDREEELKAVLENANLTFSSRENQVALFDEKGVKVLTLTRPENAALVNDWSIRSIRVTDGTTASVHDEDTGIRFLENGEVQVQTACNSGGGRYGTEDNGLQIEGLALTEMACEPERNKREQELIAALSQINGYSLLRNTLSLEKDAKVFVQLVLEE